MKKKVEKQVPCKELISSLIGLKNLWKNIYLELAFEVINKGQDGFTDEKYINIPKSIEGNVDGKKTLFHQLSIDTKTGILYLYQINELDEGYHVSIFSLPNKDMQKIFRELKSQILE